MNTEEQKMKAAIASKYAELTPEQIADDVMLLIDKAIKQGIDSGYELAKKKFLDGVKDWERQEIMKIMMGQL